jgi:hypothetical protein
MNGGKPKLPPPGIFPMTNNASSVSSAWLALSTSIAILVVSIPTSAHHGTGISYIQDQTIQIKGKVTEFSWGPSSPLTPKGLAQVNANKPGKGPRAPAAR